MAINIQIESTYWVLCLRHSRIFHQASAQRPTCHVGFNCISEVPREPREVVLPGECLFEEIGKERSAGRHPALGALIFLALSTSCCLLTDLILTKRPDLCSCARPRLKSCNPGKTNEKGAITRRNKQTQRFPLSARTTSELQKPKATRYPRAESNEPTAPLGSWWGVHTNVERGNSVDGNASPITLRRRMCHLVVMYVSESSQPSPSDFPHARCFQGTKYATMTSGWENHWLHSHHRQQPVAEQMSLYCSLRAKRD